MNSAKPRAVATAAAYAESVGKRVVTFKIFRFGATNLKELLGQYFGDAVILVLQRNALMKFISGEKIGQKCSSPQRTDSTECKLTVNVSKYTQMLWDNMNHHCSVHASVGALPFPPLNSTIRVAWLRYEELDAMSSTSDMSMWLQAKVNAAGGGALASYRPNGKTARLYTQQDKNHTVESSVLNMAQLEEWYTDDRVGAICQSAMTACVKSRQVASAHFEKVQRDAVAWCKGSDLFRMPDRHTRV